MYVVQNNFKYKHACNSTQSNRNITFACHVCAPFLMCLGKFLCVYFLYQWLHRLPIFSVQDKQKSENAATEPWQFKLFFIKGHIPLTGTNNNY